MAPSERRSRVAAVLESRVFYSHRSRMHSIPLEPEPETDSMKDSYRCQMGRIRKRANPGLTRISGRREVQEKKGHWRNSEQTGTFQKNGLLEKRDIREIVGKDYLRDRWDIRKNQPPHSKTH